MQVELRSIPDFPGYYIGSDGLAYSTWRAGGLQRPNDPRPLTPVRYKVYPYLDATLSRNGRKFKRKLHVLVCVGFHGAKPTKRHQVRHLDGNHKNNRATNLCWGLPKDNAADMRRHGTLARGERHGHARLTEADVRTIRSSNEPQKVLACRFGVSQPAICKIRKGEVWSWLEEC